MSDVKHAEAFVHLDEQDVVDFALQSITKDRELKILEHLNVCSECGRQMLALLEATARRQREDGMPKVAARDVSIIDEAVRLASSQSVTPCARNEDCEMLNQQSFNTGTPQTTVKSWANQQKDADTEGKRLVAAWASRHFGLNGASGVYFDAGSASLIVWQEIAQQIVKEGHPSQIKVLTNNSMILNDFANDPSPLLHGLKMASVGENFDVLQQAFFGPSIAERLRSGVFRPEVIYIGTNGISFSEDGAILFGFHADDPEREVKELLFANPCKAKARVILATAKKVGNPGGTVFDILKVSDLDCRSPLFLLSTAPSESERDSYDEALRIFKMEAMQRAIRERGLNFQWIEVGGTEAQAYRNITEMVLCDRQLLEGTAQAV
jgi:hypothetical protein